jgi:TusA-related sulfurtransferase
MIESRKIVDARGLACPEPVVLTKKAVEEGGFDILEVRVGSESARENVLRYAGYAGLEAALARVEGPEAIIEIRAAPSEPDPRQAH